MPKVLSSQGVRLTLVIVIKHKVSICNNGIKFIHPLYNTLFVVQHENVDIRLITTMPKPIDLLVSDTRPTVEQRPGQARLGLDGHLETQYRTRA